MRNWFSVLHDWRQEWEARFGSGAKRSPQWNTVRNEHFRNFPRCRACGRAGEEVHHGEPFKLVPERELDPTNLFTYCKKDHLSIGHLGTTTGYNPEHEILASLKLACVTTYLPRTEKEIVPQEHVVYRTALASMRDRFSAQMPSNVRAAISTVETFVENQRPK